MNLFDFINGIEQGYINQRPNIKAMRRLLKDTGWNAEYTYSFVGRWFRWVYYYDCDYTLTRNYDDSRNYTA